ncbi:MAG: 50S ribosomal protein L25 [Candidatus Marinimicrobia bacterium]|jgi:large subunit ribosomal protein L25|nr:50S ribosomal protein L25 [Candidatus Neomarinimicrobiota bacterium]MBT4555511.1 50S ribosomal protein L25 [Candidatus Neomarinimicrobiota bacterium]MBT4753124.1 50S ribosomal protein L25 [Candidatus Neomarinimicrobiota bacterium]MBT5114510.1 50S ribosomal protein L25 [Candidatus Neomarinimicrobiota bacterium]MBT5748257.1 50S ribosomal protein L25 [Candidatus Neomarinimicrobiota bacterium]|tara:strand:+ start:1217 stop:1885 length:669 start_codon:yes stop_codon:yes gene_type:complete
MASSYYKLDITDRTQIRTKGSKALRREGIVPGVLYYAGEANVNISVDKMVLFHALQSGQRIYEIEQKGDTQFTMIKELQYHPVTDEVIHIDLMRVRRSEKMTISVPLVLVGESDGVKEGGILSQAMNQIEISCFPTDVPENILLNIEDLEMNSSKSVADISLDNDDIEILSAQDINVVSIHMPAAEEEPEVEDIGDEEGVEGEETTEEGSDSDEAGGDSKES